MDGWNEHSPTFFFNPWASWLQLHFCVGHFGFLVKQTRSVKEGAFET